MRFEKTRVMNFDGALRGMRNPLNSGSQSDSAWEDLKDYISRLPNDNNIHYERKYIIGKADMNLAQRLIKAGSEHRKFMRQIFVCVDITAPLYWWKEFDTYKVATVRNSCSTMHKIHSKPFEINDFAHDSISEVDINIIDQFDNTLIALENLRQHFNETKDKKYWKALIQMLPDGYEMKATVTFNYETLLGMCSKGQRRNHKLNEWSGKDNPNVANFISWAKQLPYSQEFIFLDELEKDSN